jgi:hypothetical protein
MAKRLGKGGFRTKDGRGKGGKKLIAWANPVPDRVSEADPSTSLRMTEFSFREFGEIPLIPSKKCDGYHGRKAGVVRGPSTSLRFAQDDGSCGGQ